VCVCVCVYLLSGKKHNSEVATPFYSFCGLVNSIDGAHLNVQDTLHIPQCVTTDNREFHSLWQVLILTPTYIGVPWTISPGIH
jgi:hypothetical protein